MHLSPMIFLVFSGLMKIPVNQLEFEKMFTREVKSSQCVGQN